MRDIRIFKGANTEYFLTETCRCRSDSIGRDQFTQKGCLIPSLQISKEWGLAPTSDRDNGLLDRVI